jgi:hypothetical protein
VSEVPRALTERRMMDESKHREDRQLAEQQRRQLPAEGRELLREVARCIIPEIIAEGHGLRRAPYEEVALPEIVDEIAIRILTGWQAQDSARVEEHVTDEDVTRWMIEARNLLPDDAPEEMVMDTFMELVRRERPEVLGFHRRQT